MQTDKTTFWMYIIISCLSAIISLGFMHLINISGDKNKQQNKASAVVEAPVEKQDHYWEAIDTMIVNPDNGNKINYSYYMTTFKSKDGKTLVIARPMSANNISVTQIR